jgi:3',5'-cyclic AMP phosphodiesterase CpdA
MTMTRAWLMSDLHQEFLREPGVQDDPHTAFDPADHAPEGGFDVVILAGDIDVPLTKSLAWIGDRFAGTPVIYVPGNHDFFVGEGQQFTMTEQLDAGRELADRLGIHLLLDGAAVIDGTRFLGGTLWTDFATVGRGNFKAKMSEAAGRTGMNDYRKIKRFSVATPGKRKRLRPEDTIAAHRATRAFLEAELAQPFEGSTIVVTHHAPHPASLDPRHGGQLDWCYASNLSTILEGPDAPGAWIHGHIHRHLDYQVGGTRICANPRGYQFVPSERDNGWNPSFVVDLGQPVPRPGRQP